MPYEWLPPDGATQRLHLWPHRSLNQRGFVWFIGLTAALIALPLFGVIGSPVVWALLPFLLAAIWGSGLPCARTAATAILSRI